MREDQEVKAVVIFVQMSLIELLEIGGLLHEILLHLPIIALTNIPLLLAENIMTEVMVLAEIIRTEVMVTLLVHVVGTEDMMIIVDVNNLVILHQEEGHLLLLETIPHQEIIHLEEDQTIHLLLHTREALRQVKGLLNLTEYLQKEILHLRVDQDKT